MRIGLSVLKFVVAIAVVAMVSNAKAQGRRGQGGGFGGGGLNALVVLGNETVQKDLELSDDQKASVTKLTTDQAAQRGQGRAAGGGAPDPTAAQQRRDDLMKKINDILIPVQQERFAEIMVQLQGAASALADPKVADKLGLTQDEKDKLAALTETYNTKRTELFQSLRQNAAGGQAGGQGAGGRRGGGFNSPELTKLTSDHNDEALAILTADQKAQFTKMTGKKIDVDPATLRGNFGGRQGGRRGQGAPGGAPAATPAA